MPALRWKSHAPVEFTRKEEAAMGTSDDGRKPNGRTAKTTRIVLHVAGICGRVVLTASELYCCYHQLFGH